MGNPRSRSKAEVKRVKDSLKSGKEWVNVQMGKILNQVAKEENLPPKQIREIMEVSWFNIRETLREHEFPIISIEGLGRLHPRIKKVKELRAKYLKQLRIARKKGMSEEVIEKRKAKYEATSAAIERLEAEIARKKTLYKKEEEE